VVASFRCYPQLHHETTALRDWPPKEAGLEHLDRLDSRQGRVASVLETCLCAFETSKAVGLALVVQGLVMRDAARNDAVRASCTNGDPQ